MKILEKTNPALDDDVSIEIEGVNLESLSEFRVRAHNNNVTTFDEVILLLMAECGYSVDSAAHYATKIHKVGQAVVFWGSEERCTTLVEAFKRIGVVAQCEKNS